VVVTLSGTDLDPQGLEGQRELLENAGAKVFPSSDQAVRYAAKMVLALAEDGDEKVGQEFKGVDLESVNGPFAAINVGLESFTESLKSQDAEVIQVDWKPVAGGNADLAALLEKMKG
jgi:FdrA protein